jgi:hypothetical protein
LEGLEIDLTQGTLGNNSIIPRALVLLVIADEMLNTSRFACALNALYNRGGTEACKDGILRKRFKASTS